MAQEKAKISIREYLRGVGLVANNLDIWENNVFKLLVENAGPTNEVRVYGRINTQTTYTYIDHIIGNGDKAFNIELYDFIKIECSIFDSPSNYLIVNGSAFTTGGSTTITGGDASAANQVIGNSYLQNINSKTQGSLLSNINFDEITVAYPTSTKELYSYYLTAGLVATIEVSYSDATKRVLTRVRRI